MKILMSGGSGLIGGAFLQEALKHGHQITVLSRNPQEHPELSSQVSVVRWDSRTTDGWQQVMDEMDAVINLAGANIGEGRWTAGRKLEIRESRIRAGAALTQAVQASRRRPEVFIQASAVGYYGDTGDQIVDEESPAATDYLGRLCVDWENSTRPVESLGVRRVVIRTGLVLTKSSGALGKLLLQYRLFAGGPLGSGEQWWPWIHLQDQARAMLYLIENREAHGEFNLCAPAPARMKEVGKTLARVIKKPYWLPVPAFALKIALGEMSKIVLEGQRAIPRRLLKQGYQFIHPDLEAALSEIFNP